MLGAVRRVIEKTPIWLRPNGNNLNSMRYLVNKAVSNDDDYIMFMLHSSEMMPGGSPVFKTEESIEKMYKDVEAIFELISRNFQGIKLCEYDLEGSK